MVIRELADRHTIVITYGLQVSYKYLLGEIPKRFHPDHPDSLGLLHPHPVGSSRELHLHALTREEGDMLITALNSIEGVHAAYFVQVSTPTEGSHWVPEAESWIGHL